ncbi:Tad domain-containing protein [Methylomicrobium lacus]|uniref:Tad domain-containing protein n=1 Tax=Methylomicrobium lacus TaxID=136992 RepID=UPI00045EB979|nr:Tad domain-containing protein [Methylomicrobium lacus]
MYTTLTSLRKAKGSVLVVTALALLVIMGMAALAIDTSHGWTNKTRLQNLADALALSAAISLNKQESSTDYPDIEEYAEYYAQTTTLPNFKGSFGNQEVTLASTDFTFEFARDWSTTKADWYAAKDINGARFVRVTTNPLSIDTWFGRILGFNNMAPSATAVAGTTPIVPCSDVLPVIACKGTDSITGKASTDKDCSDGNCFGYATDTAFCFKSSPTSPTGGLVCPDIPPAYTGGQLGGNFGWMDVGAGGADLKACAAGDPTCQKAFCESFAANGTVTSKTGDVASVDQGFNTRFDDYNGSYKDPALYPPDRIVGGKNHTKAYNQTRSDQHDLDPVNFPSDVNIAALTNGPVATTDLYRNYYKPMVAAKTASDATHAFRDKRRVLSMPFVDCSAITKNAKGTWDVPSSAVDWGCVFITRPIPVTGSLTPVYAEVIDNSKDDCMGIGKVISNVDTGIYKVQLYKDPFGGQS